MKALQSTDNAQEPKSETLENKATYRAPRLVALGTAVDLVQFAMAGHKLDSTFGNGKTYQ
jgi:hypothetical protein